jgi:aminoglycoside 6'-N-acetyltransferase I
MAAFCSAPERYAQFLFRSHTGEALGLIEVAQRTDYVNGTSSSPVAFLEGIFVSPGARRQGIARALVAKASEWARSQGCREFASDALLENESSHVMHRALGFKESERVVFFRKQLPP